MTRAALYVRASTDYQKYSTLNQEASLRAYARDRNFEVARVYSDDGRSGLDLKGRDALRQLLIDVLEPNRDFEILLVLDVSRWGRFQDTDESAYYEFLCRRAGVRIIYCAEMFLDDSSPMTAVLKSIKRAMAAEYSRELSRKVSVGQRRLVAEGFSQGGVPQIGLRRLLVDQDGRSKGVLKRMEYKSHATDRIILVPGPKKEIDFVNRLFRMCADDGLGPSQIARILNKERRPGPMGGPWYQGAVAAMLSNENTSETTSTAESADA